MKFVSMNVASLLFIATVLLLATLSTEVEAFAVTKTLSKQPAMRTSPLQMTVLTYNGKKKDFKAGTPLSAAVTQLGIKPKYSCRKGDCATCQIMLAGRMTKPCVAKVPAEPTLKSLKEKGLEIRL